MALLMAAPVPGDPICRGLGLEMGRASPTMSLKDAGNAVSHMGIHHLARAGTVTVTVTQGAQPAGDKTRLWAMFAC